MIKLNTQILLSVSLISVFAYSSTNSGTTSTTAPAATKAKAATNTTSTTTAAKPMATTTATAATNTAAVTSTAKAPEKKEEAPSVKFGLTYSISYGMQAKQQPDGSRSQAIDHTLMPSMRYGDYNSTLVLSYNQDLVNTQTNTLGDPALLFGRKGWKVASEYLTLTPGGSLVVPTSDNLKNNIGLIYSIGGTLTSSLNTKKIGMDSFLMQYMIGYTRNFTTFDTTATGDPNTMYSIRNRINLGYNFTDALSLYTRWQIDARYSVEGVVRNSFSHFQSLGYSFNDTVSMSVTHSNGGSWLKSGTYENNFKFFDDASSEYSVGLDLSI